MALLHQLSSWNMLAVLGATSGCICPPNDSSQTVISVLGIWTTPTLAAAAVLVTCLDVLMSSCCRLDDGNMRSYADNHA